MPAFNILAIRFSHALWTVVYDDEAGERVTRRDLTTAQAQSVLDDLRCAHTRRVL